MRTFLSGTTGRRQSILMKIKQRFKLIIHRATGKWQMFIEKGNGQKTGKAQGNTIHVEN